MKYEKGNILLIIPILLVLISGVGFFIYVKSQQTPALPQNTTKVTQERTKTDKYKISDIYFLQKNLSIDYPNAGYPGSFPTPTGYSTYKVLEPMQYKQLNNGADYELAATLDDGTVYKVKSRDFPTPNSGDDSSKDTYRIADLMGLFHSLKGYHNDKGRYPDKLADLIEAGWMAKIATDPSGVDYNYEVDLVKDRFDLSANLSVGIEFIFRSEMDI